MADEIKFKPTLTLVNGLLKDEVSPGQIKVDQTNARLYKRVHTIGTTEESITAYGDVATPGLTVLYNLDACDGANPIPAFAARCELGFLTGAQIPTFAYIDPQTTGRNYLCAQMKPYAHMHAYDSLAQACAAAIAFAKAKAHNP